MSEQKTQQSQDDLAQAQVSSTAAQVEQADEQQVEDQQAAESEVVAAEVEIDPLQAALHEVVALKDKLLRQHADMDNLRKRTQREVADARKFAVERFAASLLDVVDNLERAVETEAGNEQAMRNGIELTLEAWHKVATKFEMERIDAVGQMFDPHNHEALSKMPSDEDDGMVIAQHVAGYTLHGRLIRAAKVLVSSGPA